MNICNKCKHFRKVKLAGQLLAQAIGTTDAAISNALVKIQEDESKQKDSEAQTVTKREISGDNAWGFRPVVSEFCGFEENKEIYLITGIKNSGGKCGDFESGQPEKKSCTTCTHRITPEGTTYDLEMEISLGSMAGQSNSTDNLLSKYRDGVASRKAFEISGAYSSKGVLATKPNYLDYCASFSSDDEYVICVLKNPYHTCTVWKGVSKTITKIPERAIDVNVPGNVQHSAISIAEKPAEQKKVETQSQPKEWWIEVFEKVSDPKSKKGWLELGASALEAYVKQKSEESKSYYKHNDRSVPIQSQKESRDIPGFLLKMASRLEDEIELLKTEILEAQKKGDTQRAIKLQLDLQKKVQSHQDYIKCADETIKREYETSRTIFNNTR